MPQSSSTVHGGLSSGYGLLIDKIDPCMKGFQVFFMQGKLHITTDFGCHQVCDNAEEEREWMSQHNFVKTGRKDWMEDTGLDELSPHSSDPSESDANEAKEESESEGKTRLFLMEQIMDCLNQGMRLASLVQILQDEGLTIVDDFSSSPI